MHCSVFIVFLSYTQLTNAPAHTSILTIQSLSYTQLTNKNLRQTKTAAQNGKHDYNFGKRTVLKFDLNEFSEGFCWSGRGRSFHVEGHKDRKGMGTNCGESGATNLEAESIRSRVKVWEGV